MTLAVALASLLILHLDFNSTRMRKDAIVDHLRTAAAAGYNAVLWEVEDKVRWTTCPGCSHPEAFTKAEFREILAEADRLGLEPIPLMQTFAHSEFVLAHEQYKAWREVPSNPTCYCVSKPEVVEFQKRLLREFLDLFGDKVRHFHLGGDEATVFGTCPVCSKRDHYDLYIEHFNKLADVLRERKVKPGLWCDMVLSGEKPSPDALGRQVRRFPRDMTVWFWDYYYGCGGKNPTIWADRLQYLTDNGYSVVFAPATASCDDGPFLPLYGKHSKNVAAAAELVRKEKLYGLCVTSWSVHLSPKALQYPLWELAAKRFLDPGESVEADFDAILKRRIGPVSAADMNELTRWCKGLWRFDSRFGLDAAKWARPAFRGTARDALAKVRERTPDYQPPTEAEIEAERRPVQAALSRLEKLPSDPRLDPFLDAARLSLRHSQVIGEELQGRDPKVLPIAATRAFYGREQSAASADNCTRMIWDPLSGDESSRERESVVWKALNRVSPGLPEIGRLKTRTSSEIAGSNWSIGCETLDRDYGRFDTYKAYLPGLGVKHARFFSGWAKTEKVKGTYDFSWLDPQLRETAAMGIEPWVCLSYGNPVYGSEFDLGMKVAPVTDNAESFAAWLNYCRACVMRYRDVVKFWEIWNEPFGQSAAYSKMVLETARAIKEIDPEAEVAVTAISLKQHDHEAVLETLKAAKALDLVDVFIYHPYHPNPDASYAAMMEPVEKIVKSYRGDYEVMQGEVGCPAQLEFGHALSDYQWTECSQVKWNLRRWAGDAVRNLKSNAFTMMDLRYPFMLQSFGMIRTTLDQKFVYRRPSYHAAANMFSFFDRDVKGVGFADCDFEIVRRANPPAAEARDVSVAKFRKGADDVILVWYSNRTPDESMAFDTVRLNVRGVNFRDPVFVDLITGRVYGIETRDFVFEEGEMRFTALPMRDVPGLVADRHVIPLVPRAEQ